jgi:fibronectin-binding autotransporter adhesin
MKPRASLFRAVSAISAAIVFTAGGNHSAGGILTWDSDSGNPGAQGGTGIWDTNISPNWWDGGANVNWPAASGTDDDAVFENTAGTVTIAAGGVVANDLTFNTTGYIINGGPLTLNGGTPTVTNGTGIDATISSIISGTNGLTKAGGGVLTLSGANTYGGITNLTAGTLKVGNASALGSSLAGAADGTVVSSGAALDVNATNLGTEVVTIAGSGIGGAGAIINSGASQINALGRIVMAADATFGGPNRWDLRNSSPTLDMGGFTLTKTGANYLGLIGAAVSNAGNVIINEGELNLTFGSTFGAIAASPSNSVTVNNGGTLSFYQSSVAHGSTLNLNTGSTLRGENSSSGTQNTWAGQVIISGNVTLKADNILNVSGVISGTGNIDKTGTNTVVLSGANTYNGNTTITAGSIQMENANALGASTVITTSGANNASLLLGNGLVTGSGRTITVLGNGVGNAFGALSTTSNNLGTAEWQGNVTIGATTLARVGTQAGNLWISGTIGENAAGSEIWFRNNLATSTILLTADNTYTGSSLIASGRVQVATIGNSGANSPLGKNGTIRLGLTNVNDGTLVYTGSGETTDKVIDLSSTTGRVAIEQAGTSGSLKFSGNFTATGAGAKTLTLQGSTAATGEIAGAIVDNTTTNRTSLAKTGTGTWILSGTNSYTGGTTVTGGTLKLDYSTNNSSKLSDTTSALTLGGGTLELSGGSHLEVVTSTTLASNSRSWLTQSSGTSVLRMNVITRNAGSTIDFAADGIAQTDTTNTNGILGAWATVGGSNWAVNSTNAGDGPITGLTTYTLTSAALDDAANYAAKNMSVDSNQAPVAAITTNSLRFNDSTAPRTLTLTGANVISSGGIMVTANVGNNASTITGGDSLTASNNGDLLIHQLNPGGVLSISTPIINTGTTNVVKLGPGAATLSGDNTYTGATTVGGGTLILSGNKTGASSTISVGSVAGTHATLEIQNGTYALGAAQFNVGNAPTVGSTGTVNQSGGAISFASGNGLLIGQGGGGTSANTGIYNMSGGSITTFASTTRGIMLGVNTGAVGGTFNLSGSGVLNMTADSGGGGNALLEIGRSDAVANNTTNLFNQTGGTANVGILAIGGAVNGSTGVNSTMTLTGGTFSANVFSLLAAGNTNTAVIHIGGTADVTLPAFPTTRGTGSTATVNFDGGTLRPLAASGTYMGGLTAANIKAGGARFAVDSGKDITVTQALLADVSSLGGGLTKDGAGKLTLAGASTYTGATVISNGTLEIATGASLAAGSAVTVSGGGLIVNGTVGGTLQVNASTSLGGAGTISGNTQIEGMHNPGNSPGIQTFAGNLSYSGGSAVINWELASNTVAQNPTTPAYDQIIVGGNLDFTSLTTLNLSFATAGGSVLWADPFWDTSKSWVLFDVTGSTGNFSNLDLNTANWTDSGANLFGTVRAGGDFNLSLNGNDVVLNYVIPETHTALLGAFGALALLRRRRAH